MASSRMNLAFKDTSCLTGQLLTPVLLQLRLGWLVFSLDELSLDMNSGSNTTAKNPV
jgi:hypothetical protein